MKNIFSMLLGGLITLVFVVFSKEYLPNDNAVDPESTHSEPEILYWVAPMDADFRRDKPGLSPMGMELVPVYAKSNSEDAGIVEISAAVENNFGVKIAKVQWSKPELSFISSGQVSYAKESLIHLHARTSGWVEKLYVSDMGEQVKKGQALYGIYSLEFIDAQKDYLRALNANDTSLIQAANNRLKALRIDSKVITKLKQSKKVSQITTFYAPRDGFIEQLNINEGMYVKPENALLTIADLSLLTVDVELDHQQAAWLNQFPGTIEWRLSSELIPSQSWIGKLDYIYPMLSEKLRTLRVRLIIDNKKRLLKPNMWLSLIGNIKEEKKILLIPKQALIRTQQKNRVVIALGEGRFKSVEIGLGRFFNQDIEIISGLQVGDSVVTSAQFLIDSESAIDSDFMRIESRMEALHDN